MNPEHPRFADWDAAYIVGALSSADRRMFEAHLEQCPECRHAISELAPTLGLLSRLSAQDAERIDRLAAAEPGGPDARLDDESVRAELTSLTRSRRRRRRAWWSVALAAAVLVVAAIAVPVTIAVVTPNPTARFALQAVAGVPIEASVSLTDVAWGTRIRLDCDYPYAEGVEAPEGGWTYALAVVGDDGETKTVSTWRAWPGSSARLDAGVALGVDGIQAIEIRAMDGRVLMKENVPR